MRTFLFISGLLVVLVALGVLLGLTEVPVAPAGSGSLASNREPQVVEEKTLAADPRTKLYLPGVAVVDLPRLLAAHPWTAYQQTILVNQLPYSRSLSDTEVQDLTNRIAQEQNARNRSRVVSDIQRIIATYAATNGLKLVFDRSASLLPERPVVEYSSKAVELHDITAASGVKDITRAILPLLLSEHTNNGPQLGVRHSASR